MLREAYSPGGPAAILSFEAEPARLEALLSSLPLVREGLVDTEVIELRRFAGLVSTPTRDGATN